MKTMTAGVSMLLLAGIGWAQQPFNSAKKEMTPAALQTEIEALKPARIAWREIPWKSCLLDGLQESREKQKPVLLWIFIDRPADDGRC